MAYLRAKPITRVALSTLRYRFRPYLYHYLLFFKKHNNSSMNGAVHLCIISTLRGRHCPYLNHSNLFFYLITYLRAKPITRVASSTLRYRFCPYLYHYLLFFKKHNNLSVNGAVCLCIISTLRGRHCSYLNHSNLFY